MDNIHVLPDDHTVSFTVAQCNALLQDLYEVRHKAFLMDIPGIVLLGMLQQECHNLSVEIHRVQMEGMEVARGN